MVEGNRGWAVFACGEALLLGEAKDWAVLAVIEAEFACAELLCWTAFRTWRTWD